MRRWGWVELPRELIDHPANSDGSVFRRSIDDALVEAQMTDSDSYSVRIAVIELPAADDGQGT